LTKRVDKTSLVLTAAQDAGGAQALAPVVTYLKKAGLRVESITTGPGSMVFDSHSLKHNSLPYGSDYGKLSLVLTELLSRLRPSLVLTATSWAPSIETTLLDLAQRLGIPNLALLDFWANYSRRFHDETGKRLCSIPDYLAIMDEYAKQEMIAEGFPQERLFVTGQPAFDNLHSLAKGDAKANLRNQIKKAYGFPSDSSVAVFFSQPISARYGNESSNSSYLGYTEYDALTLLLDAVKRTSMPLGCLVKLHPEEKLNKFDAIFEGFSAQKVAYANEDSGTLISVADAVLGMISTILVQSYLLGKHTISIQPDLRGTDSSILGRIGVVKPTGNVAELVKALNKDGVNLMPSCNSWRNSLMDGRATERVANLIFDVIKSV